MNVMVSSTGRKTSPVHFLSSTASEKCKSKSQLLNQATVPITPNATESRPRLDPGLTIGVLKVYFDFT